MSERDELNMRVSAMRAIEAVISEFPDTGNPIKRYVDFLAGERMRLWEAQRYAATPAPSAPEPLLTRGAAAVSNAAVPAGDGRKKLIEAILDEVLDESDDTLSVGAFDEIVDRLSALPAAAPSAPVDGWFPLLGTPFAVRRSMLNEEQAKRNHSQTLDRLAQRGGLAPAEACAVMERRDFRNMDNRKAFAALIAAAPTGPAARQPKAVRWQCRANSIESGWTEWRDIQRGEYETLRRSLAVTAFGTTQVRALYTLDAAGEETP